MTSFIIYGNHEEQVMLSAQNKCSELGIDVFDRVVIAPTKEEAYGVITVRRMQQKAFLKPLRGIDKAIIISASDSLNVTAQNSLLKLLEEPPAHTYLFLLAQSLDSLLPTIKSRCQILFLKDETELTDDEQEKIQNEYASWGQLDTGGALKKAETLAKDKDKTIELLKKIIIYSHILLVTDIKEGRETKIAQQLPLFQQTYRTLTHTNTNPRLTLEHLFLSIIPQ